MQIDFYYLKCDFHIDFANTSDMYLYCMVDMNGLAHNMCDINIFIMKIDYVKIIYKDDIHICRTNFAKKNGTKSHEIINWQKIYGKLLFSKDLEVRGDNIKTYSYT